MPTLNTAATVDFTKVTGKLNHALHGSNNCPSLANRNNYTFSQDFLKMNFYATRTHDWALWNAGQRMVDTHFIFPLMKLDPADPTNYYFRATDDIIKMAHDCNMRVFYRLGTSIEHSGANNTADHYNTLVPEDFDKYAEVLAGIVRHYTRGWADGFEYDDMKYWEIWNEPDLFHRMWCGTYEEFVRFFVIVLKRLKSEFPELKIGGPALKVLNEPLFRQLLAACKEAGIAPDFISWHRYSQNVDEMVYLPVRARKLLDELGFTETELCINEWHYLTSWEGISVLAPADLRDSAMNSTFGMHGIDSACFNLAVLSGWQDGPLDSAFYYGASPFGPWGFRDGNCRENKNSFSMKMFGRLLFEAEEKVESARCNLPNTVYTLAAKAKNGNDGILLVTDYRGEGETVEIEVNGMEDAVSVSAEVLDNDHNQFPARLIWDGRTLTLLKNRHGSAAFYVTFKR